MSTTIEHSSVIDVRDLADLAQECIDIVADDADTYDADERAEAQETLDALAKFMNELGYWDIKSKTPDDWEELESEIRAYGENEPTLISADYFTEYCEELCKEIGDFPKDLPWYIANHIDWDGVASDIKVDYNEVTLDGEDYLIRSH